MPDPEITTREEWLAARLELLAREKELTRHRDAVNAARRRLPMVEITKDYAFDTPHGEVRLIDLFEGRTQLVVFHLMFEPDADQPVRELLVLDRHHRPPRPPARARHVLHRDLARPAGQAGALPGADGLDDPGCSSYGSDFNYDFHVTLDPAVAPVQYAFKDYDQLVRENPRWEGWAGEEIGRERVPAPRRPHLPHVLLPPRARIDLLNGTYNWLDLTALGRQEDWEQPPGRGKASSLGWVRRRDEYDAA